MARKKPPTFDVSDEMPAPAAPGDRDVDDMMRLLLWGREKGFRVGPVVRVGAVTVQIADLRQAKGEGAGMPAAPDMGIDAEYGLVETDEPVDGTAG